MDTISLKGLIGETIATRDKAAKDPITTESYRVVEASIIAELRRDKAIAGYIETETTPLRKRFSEVHGEERYEAPYEVFVIPAEKKEEVRAKIKDLMKNIAGWETEQKEVLATGNPVEMKLAAPIKNKAAMQSLIEKKEKTLESMKKRRDSLLKSTGSLDKKVGTELQSEIVLLYIQTTILDRLFDYHRVTRSVLVSRLSEDEGFKKEISSLELEKKPVEMNSFINQAWAQILEEIADEPTSKVTHKEAEKSEAAKIDAGW